MAGNEYPRRAGASVACVKRPAAISASEPQNLLPQPGPGSHGRERVDDTLRPPFSHSLTLVATIFAKTRAAIRHEPEAGGNCGVVPPGAAFYGW